MQPFELVKWVHLLAAATWMGGLVTLAALVVALRREGVERSVLQAAARMFGHVSWTAMVIAVITGTGLVDLMGVDWSYPALHRKLGFVALTIAIAGLHQATARRSTPSQRGVLQVLIFVVTVGLFGAAVAL